MAELKQYFAASESATPKGRNIAAKRRIIAQIAAGGDSTIADISKALDVSIPTITKLICELVSEGIVVDLGKVETAGGRRPNVFGIHDPASINFLGVSIENDMATMVVVDLQNNVVAQETAAYSPETVGRFAAKYHETLTGICLCTQGPELPAIDLPTDIAVRFDTATRAMCHAERSLTDAADARDMLYIDLSGTASAAIVVGGELYYGHSGLTGMLPEELTIPRHGADDDEKLIGLAEDLAGQAGVAIASLIKLLNPELVVIGGALASAGDYLMLPLQAAIHKHTPKALYRDTRFRLAQAGDNAAALGAAIMIRNKILGLL